MRVKVKVAQLCPTLCDSMDLVHGILQARILQWVAFPSPVDLPNPGIEPRSPTSQAYSLQPEPPNNVLIVKQQQQNKFGIKRRQMMEHK